MSLFLLDDVLKIIYNSENEIKLINIDDISRNSKSISDEILHVRLGQNGNKPYNGPIIIYGFDSLEYFIRYEKNQNPLLLVSPGVFYFKIPCDISIIYSTLEKAKNFAIPPEQFHELLKEYLIDNRAKRVESVWAHKLGNFFGSEKLLYGAYLGGAIKNWDYFCSSLEVIRNDQKKYLSDLTNDQEFSIYHFSEAMKFSPIAEDRPLNAPLSGKILYIDDHAHLGWANAITIALGGPILSSENELKDNILFEKKINIDQSIEVWSFYPQITENLFLEQINKFIKCENLDYFDAIILDLRLQSINDEKEKNLDEISGNKLLKSIREVNPLIPVLMLTASRKARNMQRLFDHGADGYFIKEITEENRSNGGKEEIVKYYNEFREIMEWVLSKSYLGAAWPVIKDIETTITDEEGIYLRKSVALLKKRPFVFEKDVLLFSVLDEAILNLNMINENRVKNDKESLDAGYLIKALRNFAAHPKGDHIEEDDAKICLYLLFRIVSNSNIFTSFVKKAFGDIEIIDIQKILTESYARLAHVINDNFIKTVFILPDNLFPDAKENLGEELNAIGKIYYHYLLFLCRLMHNNYFRFRNKTSKLFFDSDYMLISYIYHKIEKLKSVEIPGNYVLKLHRKGNSWEGYIEYEMDSIFIKYNMLDDNLKNDLRNESSQKTTKKVTLHLSMNGPIITKSK